MNANRRDYYRRMAAEREWMAYYQAKALVLALRVGWGTR